MGSQRLPMRKSQRGRQRRRIVRSEDCLRLTGEVRKWGAAPRRLSDEARDAPDQEAQNILSRRRTTVSLAARGGASGVATGHHARGYWNGAAR